MADSMELTIMDRIVLLELLPDKGSYTALKEMRELREELGFSEAEVAEFDIVHEDGVVRWDSDKEAEAEPKTVVISDYLHGRIITKVRQLDKSESLPEPFFDMVTRLGYEG
jgi:RecA-family ATPase